MYSYVQGLHDNTAVATTSSSGNAMTLGNVLAATISSATLGIVTTLVTVLTLRSQRRKRQRALALARRESEDDLDRVSVTSDVTQTQL